MGLRAKLASYLAPNGHSAREHREANREYSKDLIQAERDYWNGYLMHPCTDEQRRKARHELDHLDTLQEQAK